MYLCQVNALDASDIEKLFPDSASTRRPSNINGAGFTILACQFKALDGHNCAYANIKKRKRHNSNKMFLSINIHSCTFSVKIVNGILRAHYAS